MKHGARLVVTAGVHEGASVALSNGHELKLGSSKEADLILIDEAIAAHHATVCLRDGKLGLQALHDGVSVFGFPLKTSTRATLLYGGWFAIGDVKLQFCGDALPDAASAQHAELAWLLRHAPLAWLARRWAWAPRTLRLVIAAMPLAAVLWYGWHSWVQPETQRATGSLHDRAFRNVRVHKDPASGVPTYEGYVQSAGDMAALSVAARADGGRYTMRVVVLDAVYEQLSDLLARYYRGATLQPREPGSFAVTVPNEQDYLQPDAWIYAKVARMARSQVDGVQQLTFVGHETDASPVRIPLGALGLNLLHSTHADWLVDAQGVRYFGGARIAAGRIVNITSHAATVEQDDGTILELFIRHANNPSPR